MKLKLSLLLALFFFLINGISYPVERIFNWPLKINNGYSSSFQEFRPGHFHGGIDIRTFQKTGYPVYAISSGYIYKIRSVKRGSGKGIYIKHDIGLNSIYFHLSRFSKNVEKISDKLQKIRGKKYFGNYILRNPIRVNSGTLIGFSGETGSGFPHLHLEIRDRDNSLINPFDLLKFPARDLNFPVIKSIIFRSVNGSKVNGRVGESFFKTYKRGKGYTIEAPVNVSGEFEIILNVYDVSDTGKHVAPSCIELFLNGERVYHIKFKKFTYSDNNQLGFVYDMFYTSSSSYFFNLFNQKGFALATNSFSTKNISQLLKNGKNDLRITVTDNFSNTSNLNFKLFKSKPVLEKKYENYNAGDLGNMTEINTENFINRDNIVVKIKEKNIGKDNIELEVVQGEVRMKVNPDVDKDGVYFSFTPLNFNNDIFLNFSLFNAGKISAIIQKKLKIIKIVDGLSQRFKLNDFEIFFSKRSVREDKVLSVDKPYFNSEYPILSDQYRVYPYTFKFMDSVYFKFKKEVDVPEQVGIFRYSIIKKKWYYASTRRSNNNTEFSSRSLTGGIFALMRDIYNPEIIIKKPSKLTVENSSGLFAIITDKGMGIDDETIETEVNGLITESEYDPDRKTLKFIKLNKKLKKGLNKIKIKVKDRGGNLTQREVAFTVH